jgi:hypothetical protein
MKRTDRPYRFEGKEIAMGRYSLNLNSDHPKSARQSMIARQCRHGWAGVIGAAFGFAALFTGAAYLDSQRAIVAPAAVAAARVDPAAAQDCNRFAIDSDASQQDYTDTLGAAFKSTDSGACFVVAVEGAE